MWDHIPHPWTLELLPCDPLSMQTYEVEVKARFSFIPDQHTSESCHTWLIPKLQAEDNVISKWRRQVIPLYSRKHCIMNLCEAPLPCSWHACPASYSGSYLNNWFENQESQSCEFHAYKQVEELFFNRACSRHGSGECMFYELRKHENTAVCQLEFSPWDKEEGWVTFGFVGVLGTEQDLFFKVGIWRTLCNSFTEICHVTVSGDEWWEVYCSSMWQKDNKYCRYKDL